MKNKREKKANIKTSVWTQYHSKIVFVSLFILSLFLFLFLFLLKFLKPLWMCNIQLFVAITITFCSLFKLKTSTVSTFISSID